MKSTRFALAFLILICGTCVFSFAQVNEIPSPSRGYVVEVTYIKGRPFSYLRIGQGSWYAGFSHLPEWKPRSGDQEVNAVRVFPYEDAGVTKIKLSVLRGQNLEFEDFVAEYPLTERITVLSGLTKFGIVPFEVRLVRAAQSVADPPDVTNRTKSLIVSTEPMTGITPVFKAKFVNNSSKPVAGFSWRTMSGGDHVHMIGMPQNRDGHMLIAPGETYSLTLAYPVNRISESTGDAPQGISGVRLEVVAVIFGDGSYEGDMSESVRFRGYKIGEKVQLTRIIDVLHSPDAASTDTLSARIGQMSYRITTDDVQTLAKEFPGATAADLESARSAAEVASSYIQKDFQKNFNNLTSLDAKTFSDVVKAAILKCEDWIKILP